MAMTPSKTLNLETLEKFITSLLRRIKQRVFYLLLFWILVLYNSRSLVAPFQN